MLAPARHGHAQDFAHRAFDLQDDDVVRELYLGDRICAPAASSGNALLRAYLFIFAVLGGGWMLVDSQSVWQIWSSAVATVAPLASYSAPVSTSSVPARTSPPAETDAAMTPAVADPPTPALQPLSSREVTVAPSASDDAPEPQSPTDSSASATGENESSHPPQQVDRHASPDQVRASEVGLNPDLSPVILAQLSPTDYRNAGIAIRTALAKTPDGRVFVWPRQRTPELALFEVHFVAGAAPSCRRYVVTITKYRWSTTALPMEKCGPIERRSASAH